MGGPGRKRIGLKKLHLDVFSFLSLLTNAESLCRLENKPSSAPDYMLPRSSGGGGASLYKRRPLPASASHEDRKEKKGRSQRETASLFNLGIFRGAVCASRSSDGRHDPLELAHLLVAPP